MPNHPKDQEQAIIANLPSKTGRTLEEWISVVQHSGLAGKKEQLQLLKQEYGVGHFQAQLILQRAERGGIGEYENKEQLLKELFTGENEPLYPLYEAIAQEVGSWSPEGVRIQPCKTYVPLTRSKQFLVVKPMKGKLVLGLALPEEAAADSGLEAAKGLGGSSRINAKLILNQREDWGSEAKAWVRKAWEAN
jgi:hypothetical protein